MLCLVDMSCCALKEIDALSHYRNAPEAALKDFYFEWKSGFDPLVDLCAATIFTQAYPRRGIRRGYGDQFAAFLQKHSLGDVEAIDVGKNPNSGKYVKMFVWKVNWKALEKYGQAKKWADDIF